MPAFLNFSQLRDFNCKIYIREDIPSVERVERDHHWEESSAQGKCEVTNWLTKLQLRISLFCLVSNLKSYVDIHIGVFIQHHKYLFKNHKYLFT